MTTPTSAKAPSVVRVRHRPRRSGRRATLIFALTILFGVIIMGIFAPWLAPEKLAPIHLNEVFLPPIWAGGTWSHPFGTDQLGHDVLSQVIWARGHRLQ